MKAPTFSEQVYAAVQKIPFGRVATYGQIAAMVGSPNASRAVGNALHKNPREFPDCTTKEQSDELVKQGYIPCHRVVNSQGRLAPNFAFDGPMEQKMRLMMENVAVDENFKVDLKKYQL